MSLLTLFVFTVAKWLSMIREQLNIVSESEELFGRIQLTYFENGCCPEGINATVTGVMP